MPTMLHPTAGYIWNVSHGAEPEPLTKDEREALLNLAHRVAEIAADPKQEEKRKLWYQHNKLEKTRPLLLIFPEDSWVGSSVRISCS